MKHLFSVLFVIAFVFGGVFAVSAQVPDDGSVADTLQFSVQAVSSPDEAFVFAETLIALVYNAVYLPIAAPLVVLLVAVSKRVTNINSNILALFYSVVLWVFWIGANELGLGGQFESVLAGVTTIAVGVFGSMVSPVAAGKLYEVARENNVALYGYSRGNVSAPAT